MNKPQPTKSKQSAAKVPASMVQPIHFEDFAGNQFERLVFAYHARSDRWISLEWFGQVGKDKGRDIVGVREVDGRKDGQTVCVLCANWRKLTLAKIKKDLDHALKSLKATPEKVRVICGHSVRPTLRDDAKAYAASKGVYDCELWSGTEFEEHIRAHAESLLYRFVQGDAFPDTAKDLLLFAWGAMPISDDERIGLISLAFNRPAFATPIEIERSLPAFKKALEDTIQVFNTGIWQTRQNVVIRRLPMIADIVDQEKKHALQATLAAVMRLLDIFVRLVREKRIIYNLKNPEDPVHEMAAGAAEELSAAREAVLTEFRKAYPGFTPVA